MKLREIINWLRENNYAFSCDADLEIDISGFASLNSCNVGEITWVKKIDNFNKLQDKSRVTVAVVQEGLNLNIPNQIVSTNSKEVFFGVLHHFWGIEKKKGFIGSGTYISPEAEIDPTAYVGYNCTIDGKVKIGANTVIENNVSILNKTIIGNNCLIHSGVVIGSDGFGFAFGDDGLPVKVEHFGGVVIGNNVEVGANTCVDRGTIDNTIICDDVKIDNLVHIAHNVVIQKGAVVVAGAIVCGSAELGDNSYVAPGGIVKNQLKIGDNAFVGLGAVVTKTVDKYSVVAGVPAKEIRKVKTGDK